MRRFAWIAGLLAGLPGLLAWAEDCEECGKAKKVCKVHEEADAVAIKAIAPDLAARDAAVRGGGADKLKETASKHLNARSPKLTVEISKLLRDPDVALRVRAAELLIEVGEPAVAVASLDREAKATEKALSGNPPGSDGDSTEWDRNLAWLKSLYEILGKSASPFAVPTFERAMAHSRPWVVSRAAGACHGYKNNKAIIRALIGGVDKYRSMGTSVMTPTVNEAVQALLGALPIVTGVTVTPKGGWFPVHDAWLDWWKDNEKKLK